MSKSAFDRMLHPFGDNPKSGFELKACEAAAIGKVILSLTQTCNETGNLRRFKREINKIAEKARRDAQNNRV